jgi:1-acyl-sn-glycerol-3-phosphate acyltransferase
MSLFLRSLGFNLVMFGSGIGLGVWALIAKYFTSPEYIFSIGRLWARITLCALQRLCNIRIEIRGREFLPQTGPALIAAQHQSAFDTLFWMTLLPHPTYVLKKELLKLPILGPLLQVGGFIPVDRNGGGAALRTMVTACQAAAEQNRQIIIFPEGTRVPPGKRVSLHPGIVALSRALQLPVIPASTNSGQHWGKKAFKKYPGILTVTIHPTISQTTQRHSLLAELESLYYAEAVDNSVN